MTVLRRDAEPVVEHHHVSVGAVAARGGDGGVARREHRLSVVGRDVEPRMKVVRVGKWIPARAERGREPPGDWPHRRRGHGELVPPLDVIAHRFEAAADHAEQLAQHAERSLR